MFAFLGVYLQAVSAHKLISQGRGVFLLHTLLSQGMWALSEANTAPAAVQAVGMGLLLLSIISFYQWEEKHSSSNKEGEGGRCGKDGTRRKDGRVLMEEH